MPILGQHLIAEYYACLPELVQNSAALEQALLEAATQAKAEPVHLTWRFFEPYGISGILIIAQSHISIHTWPEYGFVSADFFTCGQENSPWIIYSALKKALKSQRTETYFHYRGQMGEGQAISYLPEGRHFQLAMQQKRTEHKPGLRERWFMSQSQDLLFNLQTDKNKDSVLLSRISPFQKIGLHQSHTLGKILVINDLVVANETDAFVFHEALTHSALLAHPAPARVLVLGAGEGGSVREVLKHQGVARIFAQEQDAILFEIGYEFLGGKPLSDPRVETHFVSSQTFLGACKQVFDVVIVDGMDTALQDRYLQSDAFLEQVQHLLADVSVLVLPLPSPLTEYSAYKTLLGLLKTRFAFCECYWAAASAASGGLQAFARLRKGTFDNQFFRKQDCLAMENQNLFRYFNTEIFQASRHLPSFFR